MSDQTIAVNKQIKDITCNGGSVLIELEDNEEILIKANSADVYKKYEKLIVDFDFDVFSLLNRTLKRVELTVIVSTHSGHYPQNKHSVLVSHSKVMSEATIDI